MSELHASVGIAHLERLGQFLHERRGYAAVYDALLEEVPGVLSFPVPHPAVSNYYKYIAMLPENTDRDALKARMRTQGIQLAGEVYQIPCCAQPYFANAFPQSQFPRAYEFCRRHICLPVFSTMTEEQQRICIDGLKTEVAAMSAVSAIA
jgi:dTDP-4-amino-4,6-dideoxygalactose transaminase